jgi:adenylate cyclase
VLQEKSKEERKMIGLGLGLGAALLVTLFIAGGAFDNLELKFLDVQHRWRGERILSKEVVVVDVDESSLKDLGWPVPRVVYAALINALGKAGARVIGVDLLLSDPGDDPDADQLLALSASMHGKTIFPLEMRFASGEKMPPLPGAGVKVQGDFILPKADGYMAPLAPLLEASAGTAHLHLDNNPDGVFRRVPLFVDLQGQKVPALALRMVMVAGDVAQQPFTYDKGWLSLPKENTLRTPAIPIDTQGRALMDFRSAGEGVQAYPLHEVMAAMKGETDATLNIRDTFKDKFVLVGTSAPSLGDLGATPLSNSSPLLLVHANLLDNILHGRFLIPQRWLLNMVLVLFMGFSLALIGAYQSQLFGALMSLSLVGGYLGLTQMLFRQGMLMPAVGPLCCALLVYLTLTIYNHYVRDVDERLYREAFKSYVAPHILERIVANPELLAVQGQRKELTLLFSDVKGYTNLSNTRPAKEVLDLLHEYLEAMVQVVFRHEGTVDKIMGDGLMVFFGDPLPQEDHAERAVRCAQDMLKALNALQATWRARGLPDLEIRVGIATGEVFVGNIGSSQHLEYTAIGPAVNLAARLESNSRPGCILISEETYQRIPANIPCQAVKDLQLKGYEDGYTAYELRDTSDTVVDASAAKDFEVPPDSQSLPVTVVTGGLSLQAEVLSWTPAGMLLSSAENFPIGEELDLLAEIPVRGKALPIDVRIVITSSKHDADGTFLLESNFMKVSLERDESIKFFVGQALQESGLEHKTADEEGVDFERFDVSDAYRQLLIQDRAEKTEV